MARFATHLLLGLLSTAAALPASQRLRLRQDIPTPTGNTEEWCAGVNVEDPEVISKIWNDWGVGYNMDLILSQSYDPPNENWIAKMYPSEGVVNIDGCGDFNDICDPQLDCTAMAAQGLGYAYFQLTAAQRMQAHFSAMHENFQDNVTDAFLSIPKIASDFTEISDASQLGSWFGISLYALGGIVGAAGLHPALTAPTTLLGNMIYLSGGIINFANLADPSGSVTVDESDLTTALHDLFGAMRDAMASMLETATGDPGRDYSLLPQVGLIEGYPAESPIAGFFADGLWLLSSDIFHDWTSAWFTSIRKKLVDLAMAQMGYAALWDTSVTDERACVANYGAQWLADVEDGGICLQLMQKSPPGCTITPEKDPRLDGVDSSPSQSYACPLQYVEPEKYNLLQEDYGFNMIDYYKEVYNCAKNGAGEPDFDNPPTDGSIPVCFFNLPSQKVEITWSEQGDLADAAYEDF